MRKALIAFGMLLAAAIVPQAQGQAQEKWPTNSITIIVPFAPGGATDFSARLAGEKLAQRLGVTIVVENKAGGATIPATEALVHSPADGSVLEMVASAFVTNSVLLDNVPYDPTKDVTPISRLVKNTSLLLVQPDGPYKTLADLVTAAKAHPGEISFASTGFGAAQHMAAESFQIEAGIKLNHIPYKGAGPALTDMLGGQVPVAFLGIGPTREHVVSGKLRALGLTTSPRSPALPDVPTIAEQGYPNYSYGEWFGFVAPKGLPQNLVERLHTELVAISQDEDYRKRLSDLGLEAEATTPQEFSDFIVTELERVKKIKETANLHE